MKHVRFYVTLSISVTLSTFTVNANIFLTLTSNIPILFIATQQYIIISPIRSIGYTALLETLQSLGETHCHAVMLHID